MDVKNFINKNKKVIGIAIISVVVSVVTYTGYRMSKPKLITENQLEVLVDHSKEDETINDSKEAIATNDSAVEEVKELTKSNIIVQIIGEVNNPGVYNLKEGSRIRDLVFAASGFTEEADKTINQALKLKDEDSILVYKIGETPEDDNYKSSAKEEPLEASSDIKDGKVNINTASKEQLKTLSGIGDGYATRIIEYREENGDFKDISEIKQVKGIGEKTFENLKDYIEV